MPVPGRTAWHFMLKRILAAAFAALMIFAVGCDQKVVYDDLSDYETESTIEPTLSVNPLTGIADISKDALSRRPVAIMVNNVSTAQGVQTGVADADIVYETEVEGGITRLMAVYQDISKLDKKRVEKVEDVVSVGDTIRVKVLGTDEKGRLNLSRKDTL